MCAPGKPRIEKFSIKRRMVPKLRRALYAGDPTFFSFDSVAEVYFI